MKKLLAVLAIIILMVMQGQTQSPTTNTPSNWSYSAGTILMSEYYGTIFGGTFYNGPMSFTDFTANWKNRFGNFIPISVSFRVTRARPMFITTEFSVHWPFGTSFNRNSFQKAPSGN